jgi:hypothetical protein
VKGAVVQTARFPGGVAVLLDEGGVRYHAVAACRWGLILWRPCGTTGFALEEEDEPIIESASWDARGDEGWGISLFAGHAYDERVALIVWGEQQQELTGARHYLFVRRTHSDEAFGPAVAYSATGQELYQWSYETYYKWVPVAQPAATAVTAPAEAAVADCPALPEGWAQVAGGLGSVAQTSFGPDSGTIYASLVDGGVMMVERNKRPALVGTHRYANFRVSPDGRTLVGGVSGELWRLDLATGAEQLLGLKSFGVLAWTSPTAFLFVDIANTPDHTVASYDLQTGAVRPLTAADVQGPVDWEQPVEEIGRLGSFPGFRGSLSPDGTQVLFAQGYSGNGMVIRLDLRSNRMYTYPRTSGDGFDPVWEPDGRHALHGWGNLFRLDTVTGAVEPLELEVPATGIGDMAADGRLLAQVRSDGPKCWVVGP